MLVRDAMTPDVQMINSQSSLQEAAITMRDLNIGALVVSDGQDLKGMITDRDLVIRGLADARDPVHGSVGELLTGTLYTCREYQDVAEAAELMGDNRVRRLIVLNESGDPVGVLSIDDLAVRTEDERLLSEALHRIAEDTAAASH